MTAISETSDIGLLDLLRKNGPQSVAQLAAAMEVTATAVRQRLTRLLAQGDIERAALRAGRGRPQHRYTLTEKGRRRAGANFADLAIALWQEIREIKDPEVRRGLLGRISRRMATLYAGQVSGSTLDERMESLAELFRERKIPFEVDRSRELPLLHATACPYPELAEQDRSVCSMEKAMFSELLGENVRLSNCRLDGHSCCTFEPRRESDEREGDAPAEPRLGGSLALPER
jgi:predicted ArsR family transcriptional regulator